MNSVQKIETWADRHHPKWIDFLRIIVGIILLAKGIAFVQDREVLIHMLEGTHISFISFMAAHYVILAHIIGGIAIAVGLLTRIAAAFQIPILIGAIIYVNLPKGFFALNSELALSILILFLLIFFFIYGSGTFSVNYLISKRKES